MTAKQKSPVISATILLVLVIVGYNIWSFCDGHCTVETLLTCSMPAKYLLFVILLAVTVLYSFKARNRHALQRTYCACGNKLRGQWHYCPNCGKPRKA